MSEVLTIMIEKIEIFDDFAVYCILYIYSILEEFIYMIEFSVLLDV